MRTCKVHQPIDEPGSTIDSPVNSSLQAFRALDKLEVEFLPENLSEKFPNLIVISIMNCSVETISRSHFKGLHELIVLYLSHNKIETIDKNAFKDNQKLVKLTLKDNKLKFIPDDLFKSLTNLEYLYLTHNQIRYIEPLAFENLLNLKNISFSQNQLESVDRNLLKNNKNLERVWFENNKLKSIDSSMFDQMKSLTLVDFKDNNCIDKHYYSKSFASMKAAIKENCTVENVEPLRKEIEALNQEYTLKSSKLSVEMENQILKLKLKDLELEKCGKEKTEMANNLEKIKEDLTTCRSYLLD
jgi:hypothetical protein